MRWKLAAVALFAAGIALRLALNNVAQFSRADETVYLNGSIELAGHFFARFPAFAAEYARTPSLWSWPTPARFGHWALIAEACALSIPCDYTRLSLLSTLGGIATLLFGWLLARELLGSKPALVALALLIASPLQLHLGRRALQDELACAAVMAALWASTRALSVERRGLAAHWIAVLFCTAALAEKETTVLWFPSLFALWWMRHRARGWRPRDLLFVLPPILFYAGFCLCSRSFTLLFQIARGTASALAASPYVAQYASGPKDRYLLDVMIAAPIPFLLGTLAIGALFFDRSDAAEKRGARELAVLLIVACVAFAFTLKDLRYFAAGEVLFRLLAAWLLFAFAVSRPRLAWTVPLLILATWGTELIYFRQVFLQRGVYDPTTFDLLRALDAVPR